MQFFIRYIKQRQRSILFFVLSFLIFISLFALYHLPFKAVIYPFMLCACLFAVFFIWDVRTEYAKHEQLEQIKRLHFELMTSFPQIQTIEDADYQEIISILQTQAENLSSDMNSRYSDMIDYYTVWAHQIKTPIASMRLNLSNEDSRLSRQLSEDLLKIEQYVEMVLAFLRLDSDSTDYIIKEYALDPIIKSALKKLRLQFISRKLSLSYKPVNTVVITDEKWLSFVIEQVLSNALKYTQSGRITISMEHSGILCIRDTGIGIAPEDLPRIFEKGYTGYNGRTDKRASGLGLYLCKQICNRLGHNISADSLINKGTVIQIDLNQKKLTTE